MDFICSKNEQNDQSKEIYSRAIFERKTDW